MRAAVLLFALVFSSGAASPEARVAPVRFADIPWGADGASLSRAMAAREFRLLKVDPDGDYQFHGMLHEHQAIVYALMAEGRLAKVTVALATPESEARETYEQIKGTLAGAYGAPDVHEVFEWPYAAGDGYEAQAIKVGKATFVALWRPASGDGEGVGLQITDRLTVRLVYESLAWPAEAKRRAGASGPGR